MTLEEVITTQTAGIAPAYPLIMPAEAAADCIVYQMISGPQDFGDHTSPRFQLACWSRTYGGAVALGDSVRQAMHMRHATVDGIHYTSMVINEMDGNPDIDAGRYARIVDVKFFYQKPLT